MTSILLLAIPALLLGPQFVAAALLGISFGLQLGSAISLVVLVVGLTYFSSGLGAAAVASTTGAVIGLRAQSGPFSRESCALAAGVAVTVVSITSIWGEGLMSLAANDLEFMLPFYSSAGIPLEEARSLLAIMAYLSPGIGAIQTVLGAVVACVLVELIAARKQARRAALLPEFRLGMPPAYITMGLLAANLIVMRTGAPELLARAVHNCLLFMSLPYGLVGLSLLRALLKSRESAILLIVALAIIFPPLAITGLVLAGLLDAWLDLHARIRAPRTERKQQ